MAEAEIGALRVRLGFDATDFGKGVKQAEQTLTDFAARAGKIGEMIQSALVGGLAAIGAGFTIAGIKKAADSLHDLGKTADELGLTTTALQELGHVALQAGISHETFNETLKTFKDRLKEAHDGSGELVDKLKEDDRAFLDILRSSTNVGDALKILSDHYRELTTEAKRTELVQAAFGSTSEELTRLLSGGSAAIDKMRGEAAGLGLVVDSASVKTGTEFAEAIRKLTVAVDESSEAFGVTLKNAVVLVTPLLLGLVDVARVVIASLNGISQAIHQAFTTTAAEQVASLTTKATDAANALAEAQDKLAKQPGAVGLETIVKTRQGQLDALNQQLAVAQGELARTTTGAMGPQPAPNTDKLPDLKSNEDDKAKKDAASLEAQRQMNQELDRYNQLKREGKRIIDENATPEELAAIRQEKLNRLLQAGAIDAETYGRAMQKATLVAVGAYASMASNIAGNLEKVFAGSKAVAIASALINTFEAATKALAAYPPPFNYAAAAATVAAGLAQVANIRSTSSAGGGGGGASASGAAANTGGGPGNAPQQLLVRGINPNDLFSGSAVRDFASTILKFQKDGGTVLIK